MATTLAFDVYGTLIDTNGVTEALREHVGDQAPAFARMWRDKQLEYSFRRGLMQCYQDFSVCVRDSLEYVCAAFRAGLTDAEKDALLAIYRTLPPFDDARTGLEQLDTEAYRLYAFSNGSRDTVERLLDHAGLSSYFIDIVSVEELKSFKPNPAVYTHLLRRTGASGCEAWLISSNPFDVIGAVSSGLRAAWIKRSDEAIFDPWEAEPTLTVSSLTELAEGIPCRRIAR